MNKTKIQGFTLIELLVVIAIIGILAGMIIPNVLGSFQTAKRSKTQAFFKELERAVEAYYTEYGTVPFFQNSASSTTPISYLYSNPTAVIETLTGRPRGSGQFGSAAQRGNPRRKEFLSFENNSILNANGAPDYASGNIVDAFGNVQIAYAVDLDGDGMIASSDITGRSVARSVSPGSTSFGSGFNVLSANAQNVYKKAVFFSAGRGLDTGDIVTSW